MTLKDQHGNSIIQIAAVTAGLGFAFGAFTGSVATFSVVNAYTPSCTATTAGAGNGTAYDNQCAQNLSALSANHSSLVERWENCTASLGETQSLLDQIKNIVA
jgi:hypothetical protein